MTDEERRRTAFHEAGHAVAAWAYGLPVDRANIIETDEWAGRVTISSFDEFEEPVLRAHALCRLAGEVAEEILTGEAIDWGTWLDSRGSDIDTYVDLALGLGWFQVDDAGVHDLITGIERGEAELRGLLQARWPAVVRLAESLLANGELSGADVEQLIARSGVPGPIATVWADREDSRKKEEDVRAALEAGDQERLRELLAELEGPSEG